MAEQRKVVTILFADVVGSTAMAGRSDPEVVRATMARYFQRITEISQSYGGTVEKFAGDAAMVVFGVPAVHDDDAERAVRAGLEIRDGASELEVRVGVNTGEAVTAAREDRQFMVSGDSVNVAARLQQNAEPGEVIVGALTEQLTRKVIDYEPREPVTARGKATPLVAFRALKARTQVPEQARGVPGLHAVLVGRDRELRLLLDTFARTAADRKAHLFTLVGSAGVGKSRLVAEALSALTSSGARVVRGRCLPYGRGITYWPLVEILRDDTGITLEDQRDAALMKLDRWLGELLHDDQQRPAIRARLSVMLGFEAPESVMPDTPAARVERELGWGMRRYLEAVAKAAPLIMVVDDLQWAEPPVVALIEQLLERVADAPILVICIARPEFLEQHRDWGAGKPNSSTITLDPLSPQDTGTLISRLLEIEAIPTALRDQIIERSAGTPLFCEEFIQMLIDEGRLVHEGPSWRAVGAIEQIRVPQSINAVLAARLDGLADGEKRVLQAASVIGQRFQLGQLQELAGAADVEEMLEALRRKGLVIGGDSDGDELAFRHLLIRDAAYGSLPKSERAVLHDRFGTTLEQKAGDPQQITEILAHHTERAFTLSSEVGVQGDVLLARALRARDWSLAMADRARTRRDVRLMESAISTVRSVTEVLPEGGGLEAKARLRLLEAQLLVMKASYTEASKAAAEAASLASAAGLPQIVATARLTQAHIQMWSGSGTLEVLAGMVDAAIDACRAAADMPGEIEARFPGIKVSASTEPTLNNVDCLGATPAERQRLHVLCVWLAADSPITDQSKVDLSRRPDVFLAAELETDLGAHIRMPVSLNFGTWAAWYGVDCTIYRLLGPCDLRFAAHDGGGNQVELTVGQQLPGEQDITLVPEGTVRVNYGGEETVRFTDREGHSLRIKLRPIRLGLTSGNSAQASGEAASRAEPALEALQWSDVGASAQCRDGTYSHDHRPNARPCVDHGGVRKWLQGRDQVLLR